MSYSTPANIAVTPTKLLGNPSMTAKPLLAGLNDINYLWLHHTPALASAVPVGAGDSRARRYEIPVIPSKDGLDYTLQLRLGAPDADASASVQVDATEDESDSPSWTTLVSSTATGTVSAGSWLTWEATVTLTAAMRSLMIRISHTDDSTDLLLSHVLLVPAPAAVVDCGGDGSSRFCPYSSKYIADADGPVSTWHLEIMRRAAVALLLDRLPAAFSLVTDDALDSTLAALPGESVQIGRGTCWLPYQTQAKLRFVARADTDDRDYPGQLQVNVIGSSGIKALPGVSATADNTLQTADLQIAKGQCATLDGTADAHVQIGVWITGGGGISGDNAARIRTLAAFLLPGV